jgi:O-antigen ligase
MVKASQRLQRWTRWAGGPRSLGLILLVQLAALGVFLLEPKAAIAMVLAAVGVVVVLERPILGVGLLLAARLLSTGALVFVRIGRMGIGPFEPVLLVCLVALVVHASMHGLQLWRAWPWRWPFLALVGWIGLSLAWSVDRGDGISELVPLLMVLANTLVILAFVRRWEDFRLMLWCWVGAAVLVGVLTIMLDSLGISTTTVTFKAASGGGRETGLGQQPNWFAMNLMFIIHTCFGLALMEKRVWVKLGLVVSGFFIFVMMLKSGSRGGAYATLIGGVLAALAHPLFRKWFLRFVGVTALIFAIGMAFDVGGTQKALMRIASEITLRQNFRQLNWLTCVQMFGDTWGLGIGAGGYETLLPQYNNYVAQSLYTYPHGIFWEFLAHYGVVGLVLLGWLVATVIGMSSRLIKMSKGTEAEIFAWTMPAAMLGYAAWSFVEFSLTEKPFWEFLSLYTALYLIVGRLVAEGKSIPPLEARLPKLWGRA